MVSFASAALLTVVGALPSWSALATQLVLFAAGLLLRRYFLSPLRGVPGPFLAKLTRLWHIHRILKGDQNLALVALHDQYGMEVSFLVHDFSPFLSSFPSSLLADAHEPARPLRPPRA